MRKPLKALIIVAGGLVLAAAGMVLLGLHLAEGRMHRKVDLEVRAVALAADQPVLDRGRYLYASRGCVDCHGSNGGGTLFLDDGSMRIKGPNISPGKGNVVAGYRTEDWVRAIRHGVAPGGRPLMIMPSEDYNRLTDADLAALVSYLKTMAPAEGGPAIVELPLPARVLYGFGILKDAAAKIDHSLPPAEPVAEGINIAHGAYVANMCIGCHGPQLAGGRIPGGPPDWPPASNLTTAEESVMPRYPTAESLLALFRTGARPDGTAVKVMPFGSLKEMSETDVRALHLYLRSLPAKP